MTKKYVVQTQTCIRISCMYIYMNVNCNILKYAYIYVHASIYLNIKGIPKKRPLAVS